MKRLSLAASALLLASLSFASVRTGGPAPEFTLLDTKGAERSLSDFKGSAVVLEWHNHECPYVRKHYDSGNLPGLQKKYTAKGVVWLAILSSAEGKQGFVTSAQADRNMAEDDAAPTHILLDPAGEVGRLYGAKTTPHMFVIDADGLVRYQGAIDSIRSADPADIPKAENFVAAALDAVLAGKTVATKTTEPYGCSVKYASANRPPARHAVPSEPEPAPEKPWWKFW